MVAPQTPPESKEIMSTVISSQTANVSPDSESEPRTTTPTASERGLRAEHILDANRDVLLAVQRGLAANWEVDQPRIAVVEQNGVATAYVSTVRSLAPGVRADVRGAVRAALAPYIQLAPYTNVVFLRRGMP